MSCVIYYWKYCCQWWFCKEIQNSPLRKTGNFSRTIKYQISVNISVKLVSSPYPSAFNSACTHLNHANKYTGVYI